MKKTTYAITLSTFITLSTGAHALELYVVSDYDKASDAAIWVKAKTDQVPAVLLGNKSTHAPGAAYSALFPKTFFQENMFAVCHNNCADKDIFKVRDGEIRADDKTDVEVIEQSNVYYWLNRYFSFLEEKLHFSPEHYLKVYTNRTLRDETRGKKLQNNAFFNPLDTTLSFLPASNNLLFKLMGGKINRSGFDPSVIGHEASHYLFQHLFPNPVNEEIGGLNEGFADYIANIFLKNPKVGLVMMHGKALRDSSETLDSQKMPKTYEPGMEVHNLGERISYALWQTREKLTQKEEFDRLVIDAVKELGQNPYSTVHDFKEKMIARSLQIADPGAAATIKPIWDFTFPGASIKAGSLAALQYKPEGNTYIGFNEKTIVSDKTASDMGVEKSSESNFTVLQIEGVTSTQAAVLISGESEGISAPYWVLVDLERGNTLGIYNLQKELVTDATELKKVSGLAAKAKKSPAFIKDFTSTIIQLGALESGKGQFATSYKIKDKSVSSESFKFNGSTIAGQKVHMVLKRKLLGGVLLGMPDIDSIDLYTAPVLKGVLPESNGQSIIGYRMTFDTGTITEVILNRKALK